MAKRLFGAGWRVRAGLRLAAAGAALCAVPWALCQSSLIDAPQPSRPLKPHTLPDRLRDKPSQPPAFSIPVEPLGFSAPGPNYLGQRNNLVSLDFLDENRLLFSFRVPGLIHRDAGESFERQIRAVVLKLPAGTVEAEALWTVYDRGRYLWMLNDGRFLLRDGENLEVGGATLELKLFLRFPGPLLWLGMDPAQQFMATDSSEPAARTGLDGKTPESQPDEQSSRVGNPGSPGTSDGDADDIVVRILRRDSGKVMLFSRIHSAVVLSINSDGYLESLRAKGNKWLLNLNYFSGGSRILGQVDSNCPPLFDFVAQQELLASTCTSMGERMLVAMNTDGRPLWEAETSDETIWPLLVRAPDGLRLAREALAITHPISAYSPLNQEDIKGQLVEVLDAADGKVALETAAIPILDGGGNVAISPSSRRVAVLNAGSIQVFELPPPPPLLPDAAARGPNR
jgi:hypothetical protein